MPGQAGSVEQRSWSCPRPRAGRAQPPGQASARHRRTLRPECRCRYATATAWTCIAGADGPRAGARCASRTLHRRRTRATCAPLHEPSCPPARPTGAPAVRLTAGSSARPGTSEGRQALVRRSRCAPCTAAKRERLTSRPPPPDSPQVGTPSFLIAPLRVAPFPRESSLHSPRLEPPDPSRIPLTTAVSVNTLDRIGEDCPGLSLRSRSHDRSIPLLHPRVPIIRSPPRRRRAPACRSARNDDRRRRGFSRLLLWAGLR